MQVTVHAAKTNLSKLIAAALAGEEVVIAKGTRPVVRIIPVVHRNFRFGILSGEMTGAGPDFFAPMDDADLAMWEGRE